MKESRQLDPEDLKWRMMVMNEKHPFLRFLVFQKTARFSTFCPPSQARHLNFLDSLMVYTMKTIYFLNAQQRLIILTTLTT